MIIDLQNFIERETPYWDELRAVLDVRKRDPLARLPVEAIRRFHYLYERVSSDLTQLTTFVGEQETRRYLESLVAQAYGEIHETRDRAGRFRPVHWFWRVLPNTFRRHLRAFSLALAITLAGTLFGGMVVGLDPTAKDILMPFPHLRQHPSQRVESEEETLTDRLRGSKAQGAAWYMTHNTRVAITTMALGATWGIGTVVMLFSNGIMVGAVAVDFIAAEEGKFLTGWLLPHGSVEIPAIVVAGQAGLVLAFAPIGWGSRVRLRERLRAVSSDLVTLVFGTAILLTWAGVIEAFLSQYHEPILPYSLKITLGCINLTLLVLYLACAGRKKGAAS